MNRHSIVTRAHLILLVAAFAGCASAPTAPTAEQLRSLQRIEAVAIVPGVPYTFVRTGTSGVATNALPVPVPAGTSAGAAVGTLVVANVAMAALEHALSTLTRAAEVPLSHSVEDIDVPATTLAQLQALRGSPAGPELVSLRTDFPTVPMSFGIHPAWVEWAKQTKADATLLISVIPMFRDFRVIMDVESLLISPRGQELLVSRTRFMGPPHPAGKTEEVVKWWAEGRYRRWLQQGIQIAMLPVAQGLWPGDSAAVEGPATSSAAVRPAVWDPKGESMRSSLCAVEVDGAALAYRAEPQRLRTFAAAYCAKEVDDWVGSVRQGEGVSFTPAMPPPVEPVSFRK